MNARYRIFLLFVAVVALASPRAQERSYTVVVNEWPPFRILDPSKPYGRAGIDMDLLDALAEAMGVSFKVEIHPWARALELIRQGGADIIMSIAQTAERAAYIQYPPISYMAVRPRLIVRVGMGASIRSYADLAGKSIGQSVSSAYFEPYNSDKTLDKISLAGNAQILAMLSLGRLDLAVGTDPNLSWEIARLGYRGQFEFCAYQPPDATPLYLGLSRASGAAERAADFERAIRALIESGAVERILEKYR